MFNSLSEKLESAFKHLKGQARINELNVANTLKDIRKALLDADVNFKIAKEFTDKVKIDFQYFLSTGRNMFDDSWAESDPFYVNYNDKTKQEAYSSKITAAISSKAF